MYRYNEKTKDVGLWRLAAIVFFVTSLVLAFVAVHNSKPVQCDAVTLDNATGQQECVLKLGKPQIPVQGTLDLQKACLSGGLICEGLTPGIQMPIEQNKQMQPFGEHQEDDYTAAASLENTGYYNPQTTQHGMLAQGSL